MPGSGRAMVLEQPAPAASGPLRAIDRKYGVLVILDGSEGSIHEAMKSTLPTRFGANSSYNP